MKKKKNKNNNEIKNTIVINHLFNSNISKILDRFGYPSKEIAGESSGIPFYILSFVPCYKKSKSLGKKFFSRICGHWFVLYLYQRC